MKYHNWLFIQLLLKEWYFKTTRTQFINSDINTTSIVCCLSALLTYTKSYYSSFGEIGKASVNKSTRIQWKMPIARQHVL